MHDDTLRIPTQALIRGRRVLVVEEEELVSRDVEVGLRNWDYTEILGGLDAGQPVVTSLAKEGVEAGAQVVIEESDADDVP
ncbi:MAG: hypothetical protein R3234_04135 [Thermoanaerobaculia bacterium]|nr:hypothetical protein [Thermoanaerobaculia bacterium]